MAPVKTKLEEREVVRMALKEGKEWDEFERYAKQYSNKYKEPERFQEEERRREAMHKYELEKQIAGMASKMHVDPLPPPIKTRPLGVGVQGRRICPSFIICGKATCKYYKPMTTKDIAVICDEIEEDIVLEDIE